MSPLTCGNEAARVLDRYLRVRSRHGQAWRRELWLGMNNRGPMTANGIYQMISRRGRQAGVDAWTHRFGITSAPPGWTAAAAKEISWSSTAGPRRRCCAATAPAPAARTTASWKASHNWCCLRAARLVPGITHMPNSACWPHTYSCIVWHILSRLGCRSDRPRHLVITRAGDL